MLRLSLILICLGAGSWAPAQQSQAPITLAAAVAASLDKSPEKRLAAAEIGAAKAQTRLARTALFPKLEFAEGVTRGDDPVFVFGTRLRQQQFTQSDFALNRLNRPTPINDFSSRFSGTWTAFDSWRTELAIHSADLLLQSARARASRSDQEIVHGVVVAYENVVSAGKQVEVAQHQAETAAALLEEARSRVEAGTSVDSDQLSAAANLSARQQELIAAQGELGVAWAELEHAVGVEMPEAERPSGRKAAKRFELPPLQDATALALRTRPDRESLAEQLQAARARVRAAKASYGPTIGTYGSWGTDRPTFTGSGGNNWIAGAELRVELLPLARRQELAGAQVEQARAAAAAAEADNQIRLEVTRAWYAQQAAGKMLDVAQAALEQSEDSLRILRDRYDAGLATMTDVLRAEDVQRQSAAGYWQAASRNAVTWADLQFAIGTLTPDQLSDLEQDRP